MAYDCAKPRGPIWKVSWAGVKDKWPGAHSAIKAFQVSNEEMGAMVAAVDLDGKDLDAVVADWIAKNEATWSQWVSN
jgi:glycine betaine/proline transport system substrate-binding protein